MLQLLQLLALASAGLLRRPSGVLRERVQVVIVLWSPSRCSSAW